MAASALNVKKAVQACAVLARFEKNRMDRLRMLKLLYLAERESFKERGVGITGGRVVAMKHGPLHSEVLDLINGIHSKEQEWSQFFQNEGHAVCLKNEPGRGELSPYEIELLDSISEKYRTFDNWEVVDHTHDFPEYKECYLRETSNTIPRQQILNALGFNEEEVANLIGDMQAHEEYTELIKKAAKHLN